MFVSDLEGWRQTHMKEVCIEKTVYDEKQDSLHMKTVLDLSEEMEVDLSKNMELCI